jgi:uncharacterized protein YbjT (DUF2867 family)
MKDDYTHCGQCVELFTLFPNLQLSDGMDIKFVLVTGATGFIGAHIVDALLARGIRVRGATRSLAKGEAMLQARQKYANLLEFVQIGDFESPDGLVEAVKDVDGIIHTASVKPQAHDTLDNIH